MTYLFPHELRQRRRRRLLWGAAWLAAILAANALDHTAWSWLTMKPEIVTRDWWQFLRAQGYLGTWAAIALAFALTRRARRPDGGGEGGGGGVGGCPGLAALLSAASAGLAAEVLKVILSRDRPGAKGLHVWHGPLAGLGHADGPGLGLPSSHAAVAFGGWFLLARAYPGLRPLAYTLAAGCGLSRILVGAHFLSDITLAAALGAAAASVFFPGRPRP
jgi:membrane-associated phospholipid phosphatase